MPRYLGLAVTALALALSAPASAQSTAADRERERLERARERQQEQAERAREREEQRRERERAGSLDTTVAFDARGAVTVSCPGGDVIVTGSDRSEIRVKARTENGGIRFSSNGNRATLEPTAGRGGGCSDGRFEVTVPIGARVTATSWSGSVTVHNVRGEVETHTQSANIDVRDVGRLDVETLSGDVTAEGVTGDARLTTVSGDIELGRVRGDVEVETVSGDLTLRDVVARQVRTHSTSGDVEFAGQIADGGRYEFATHSGTVRLQLPPDVGAQLSVSTFNGAIESDFPITLRPGGHDIGRDQGKKLNFTLGQGGARITVETFSGDITLSSAGRRR